MGDTSGSAAISNVTEFYKNANVFLTGGTGFLGLAVIDKILRSLPEVKHVYLLMRAKKGKSMDERLQELTKNEIFERLLETESPDIFKKLIPIEGDVGAEDLGISTADRATLVANVNVVIHSAASLDFNETLRSTVNINLLGTRRILELCKQTKGLKAMVHVSSAYVNSWRPEAEEILYPLASDLAEKVIDMVESLNDGALSEVTPSLLGVHVNTYTFTKHLAEQEVDKYVKLFPCGIVRPSMIQPAWREPVPGWTMSKNGPQGFLMGAAKGVVRRLPSSKTIIYDYIPVDVVANQLIATAQHIHQINNQQLNIFHATTSTCNPFRWSSLKNKVNTYLNDNPLQSGVWYAHLKLLPTLFLWKLAAIFVHFVPAYLLDTVTRLSGGRPILVRMHTNIWNSLNLLYTFMMTEWLFYNPKTLAMADSMSAVDQTKFGFDCRTLVWKSYYLSMVIGVRRYLLKEHPRNLKAAQKKQKILLALHIALHVVLYGLGWWLTKTVLGGSWIQTAIVLPIAYTVLSFF